MASLSDGLHDLSRVIGELQAKVQSLENHVKDDTTGADKHRQAVRVEISALSMAVARLVDEVKEIAPIVEDYRDRLAQAKGGAKVLRFLWAALGALAVAVGTIFGWLMSHLYLRP